VCPFNPRLIDRGYRNRNHQHELDLFLPTVYILFSLKWIFVGPMQFQCSLAAVTGEKNGTHRRGH